MLKHKLKSLLIGLGILFSASVVYAQNLNPYAENIQLAPDTTFDGNLTSGIGNVQQLADAVDNLVLGSGTNFLDDQGSYVTFASAQLGDDLSLPNSLTVNKDVFIDGNPIFMNTEAKLEAILGNVSNVFTNNDGALNDDDVSLADVQSATSSDFHNIGGTDDDVPESGDFGAANDLDAAGDVANDSHNHTGTTISSLDISDDTNLAAGYGLVLTGDSMAVDGNLTDDNVTAVDVGLASPDLDDSDASVQWENANDLNATGDVTNDSHDHTGATLGTIPASDITSGTFADARIAESNVTQHQAALSITESQISDLSHISNYITDNADDTMNGSLVINDDLSVGRDLTINSNALYVNSSNNRVGIGTISPASTLNINGGVGSLATGLSFGDGDTGFYESVDDTIYWRTAGTDRWEFTGQQIRAIVSNGSSLRNVSNTSTVPGILPRKLDLDTGLGSGADDELDLITAGVNALNIDSSQLITVQKNLTIGESLTVANFFINSMSFPTSPGTAGQVLEFDSNGNIVAANDDSGSGGGAGAFTGNAYVTMELESDLTQERVLAVGSNLSLVDGGAESNATISFQNNIVIANNLSVTNNLSADGNLDVTGNAQIDGTMNAGTVTGANVTSGANPGHTHTTTSISGLDISDDTNLAGGTGITLTDDTLSADIGTSVDASEIDEDAVGTSELDDDANSPTAGDIVIVEAGAASFDYITQNAGTDVTADLEEETHASEHQDGGADPITSLGNLVINNDLSVTRNLSADGNLDITGTATIDGAVTGASFSGVGTSLTALDDDNVNFDDADSNFTATTIGAAVEELDDVNGSGPNASDGKVDWSQLVSVPAGFADGTDDGGAGGDISAWLTTSTVIYADDFTKDIAIGDDDTSAEFYFDVSEATLDIRGNLSVSNNVSIHDVLYFDEFKTITADDDFQIKGNASISDNLSVNGSYFGEFFVPLPISGNLTIGSSDGYIFRDFIPFGGTVNELYITTDEGVSNDVTFSFFLGTVEQTTTTASRPFAKSSSRKGDTVIDLSIPFTTSDEWGVKVYDYESIDDLSLVGTLWVKGTKNT